MTEMQKAYLLKEEYEARHKTQGTNNQYVQRSEKGKIPQFQNSVFTDLITGEEKPLPPLKNPGKEPTTRNIIAQEHGISPDDVRSAVEVGRGIDRAAEVDPEFKKEVLSGEVKASKKDIADVLECTVEDLVEDILSKKLSKNEDSKKEGE